MNSPIASIDLGTNSLNTLVVLVSNNKIKNIEENCQIIGLGKGISKTGLISNKAIKRCIKGFNNVSNI